MQPLKNKANVTWLCESGSAELVGLVKYNLHWSLPVRQEMFSEKTFLLVQGIFFLSSHLFSFQGVFCSWHWATVCLTSWQPGDKHNTNQPLLLRPLRCRAGKEVQREACAAEPQLSRAPQNVTIKGLVLERKTKLEWTGEGVRTFVSSLCSW